MSRLSFASLPVLCSLALTGAYFTTSSSTYGQEKKVQIKIEVDSPKFDDLASPNVGGNTGKKNWAEKDWLEVEVKVKLDARNAPRDGFIDRLTVKWYVAVENKVDRDGPKYYLMEKDVTHVNVPIDEDFYLSVYLSPATIKRLTGRDRAGKNAVMAVGGEINCEGAVKPARFTSKGDVERDPWWNSETMGRTKKYPLLNKNETPFKFLWWDRYLEIQPES